MLVAPQPGVPVVLSYLALRRAVGWIAFGLPFALIVPWSLLGKPLPSSISGYYHTGMRNLLVGSLCAVSMYLLGCRGYDRRDEMAGIFAAVCALGVAFFPTAPTGTPSPSQFRVEVAHYVFAALLFSTLAYFCLALFRLTSAKGPTRRKLQRNRVYTVCGYAIIVSMLLIAICKLGKIGSLAGLGPTFCFETTSLLAFGIAWLVKGETFLKDLPGTQKNERGLTKVRSA